MKSKFKVIGRFAVAFVLILILVCSLPSTVFAKGMGYTWPSSVSSIEFYYVPGSFTDAEATAIRSAFNTWTNVRYSYDFDFKPMHLSTRYSENLVAKPTVWTYGGVNAGYCDISYSGTVIYETDIYFNRNVSFSIGASSGCYDLQSIALHEAGHALGIAHCHEGGPGSSCVHYSCLANVMYPVAVQNGTKRTLQSYDYSSYVVLYPNA